jgi:trans-aconitate 2-methyltransferase
MGDWDPDSYLRFADERTQPSTDLVSRIGLESPGKIVDIGCGPGNSTRTLRRRWPESGILGLDYSEAMIAKARQDYPDQRWEVGDAAAFDAREEYDLVFSNATLQWIPNHEDLVPRLFRGVKRGGALAVQIPMFKTMPVNLAIEAVAERPEWRPYTGRCAELFTFHAAAFYYDLLSSLAGKLDLWETSYIHVLDSHSALLDFCRSTALRPYHAGLPSDESRSRFDEELVAEFGRRYALQRDGKLLFPFIRLFFIGYKAS